jgi:hypothetical protein
MLETVALVPEFGPSVATKTNSNSFGAAVENGPTATVAFGVPTSLETLLSIPIAPDAALAKSRVQAIREKSVSPILLNMIWVRHAVTKSGLRREGL